MKNKGITLVSLTVTIIILVIIAGISVSVGKNVIKKAKLEELKTNMLLIQAKAKEYVEEANFKMGKNATDERKQTVKQEIYEEKAKLITVSDSNVESNIVSNLGITDGYVLNEETYNEWGLNKIKTELKENESYIIKFDDENLTVEVYNIPGYKDGNSYKYSLTEIEEIREK